ncbi:MAG: hypothetical protein QM379_11380 [Acidobacteriota bacterium]|nr:hypothetical protein [Acidobacteriota bacterium]
MVVVVGDATMRVRRRRERVYGAEVVAVVTRLWKLVDCPSGKRLVAALPAMVEALERHGELTLPPEVRRQVLTISAATIDRVLASERKQLALRSRSRTKPGTLLKHAIPVRTFADWDEQRPGFAVACFLLAVMEAGLDVDLTEVFFVMDHGEVM